MHESIVFCSTCRCRRKESSRSLSHLLMSFLLFRGSNRDRLETLPQCAEWSQFAFRHFEDLTDGQNSRAVSELQSDNTVCETSGRLAATAVTTNPYISDGGVTR